MSKEKSSKVRLVLPVIILAGLAPMTTPMAAGEEQGWLPRATIHPSVVTLEPGQQQWFKAVRGARRLYAAEWIQDVQWSVNHVPGGNAELGAIGEDGTYTAPAKVPTPREVHVCARVEGVANPLLWATVLFEAPGEPYALIKSWGEDRETSKHFVDPHCIALDKDGNILVADYRGSMVNRFTPDGEHLGIIGDGQGEAPGQVYLPRVVLAGPDGNIYVSDQKSDKPRIQVFTHEGKFIRIFAPKGTGKGHILRSHGMGFDPLKNLFVVDVDNMRVSSFTREGKLLQVWGNDGRGVDEFNAPHGLVVDPNGELFISGYYGTCRKFTNAGGYLFSFAHADPPEGAVYIHSSGGDQWGNVYLMVRGVRGYGGVVEQRTETLPSIMKYNNNGDHVANITLDVSGHSENWATVDEQGRVYAVYASNDKFGVQIYEPR